MQRKWMLGLMAIGLAMGASTAWAQMPADPACAAPVAAAGDYAPWNHPTPLAAAGEVSAAPPLALGSAAQVSLLPTPEVHYAQRPEKPGGTISYGGLLVLDVKKAGTYRLALSTAAWLDVIGKEGALRSVAHGHGPDCTGIRKMVDFPLMPGRYHVQIAANGAPNITVLAIALP